jgi:small-conductance mechanosensitive channel
MLHRGTLFVLLFFGLFPGVSILLLWRSVRRGVRQVESRGRILVAAGIALAVWAAATYYMFAATFVTAWGVAHMGPVPSGMFPEGWIIYGLLAAYAILGATLVFIVGKMPRERAAA